MEDANDPNTAKSAVVRLPTAPTESVETDQYRNLRENAPNLMSRVLYTPKQASTARFQTRKRKATISSKALRKQAPTAPGAGPAKSQKLIPKIFSKRHDTNMFYSPVTPAAMSFPRPPAGKRNVRELSGREKALVKTQNVSPKENFDLIFEVKQKVKKEILSKRKTFMKGQKEDKVLRKLILYPKKDSFMTKMYKHRKFQSDVMFLGGFQYLKRAADNSYNLEPALPADVDSSEYFTISQTGVTHVVGEHSDFVTLEQFEHEYVMFDKIMGLEFFQRYKKWKNFTFWKKNVRRHKMDLAQKSLNESSFILSPEFRTPLLKIRLFISNLMRHRLFKIEDKRTYKLHEFQDTQIEQRDFVKERISGFAAEVLQLMTKTCSASLTDFLELNGFPQDDKSRRSSSNNNAGVEDEDVDLSITFTERAAMRTQCRRLMKFIQLVDFLVIGAHVDLAVESIRFYLNQLCRSDELKLFEVEIISKTQQKRLLFSPPIDDFKGTLDVCVFDTLREVTVPQRLLTHNNFAVYVQPAVSELGKIGATMDGDMILMQNHNFRAFMKRIAEKMNEAFLLAKDSSKKYDPFYSAYLDNVQSIKRMTVEVYNDHNIEQLVGVLESYREQEVFFQTIPSGIDAKIIQINGSVLLNQISSSPTDCLAGMYELIPRLGDVKNQKALDELIEKNDVISATPLSVAHFVELRAFLEKTNDRMYDLEDECMYIMKFFKMMEDQNIEISEELSSKNHMMYQLKSSLNTSITRCEDGMNDNMSYFGAELKSSVKKLKDFIMENSQSLNDPMITDEKSVIGDVVNYLENIAKNTSKIEEQALLYAGQQDALAYMVTEYEDLPFLQSDLKIKKKLWDSLHQWTSMTEGWLNAPFEQVDPYEIEKQTQLFFKVAVSSEKKLPDSPVPLLLRSKVEDFKLTMPVVNDLRTKDLRDRHWVKIHMIVGYEINGIEGFTVGKLIEKKIMDHAEDINGIALEALNEAILEDMLAKVAMMWKRQEFEVLNYKEQKNIFILGSVEEVLQNMDDSLVTLGTIMGSRYVAAIRENVEVWQKKLVLLQETLEEWLVVQKSWMYLENIFAAPDIQRQLPNETKQFEKVDKSWKGLMRVVATNPNCVAVGCHKGRKELFRKHSTTLDSVQKRLEEYLETKRASFPRFYFLSNDELLEILAQTKDPRAVQPYLRKCFDNLVALEFRGSGILDINSMMSGEGEKVQLGKNLKARGTVEEWLTKVEERMRVALQGFMKEGVIDHEARDRKEWVFAHAAQVVTTVDKIMWGKETERVLAKIENGEGLGVLRDWLQKNLDWLADLTSLIRKKLTKLQRKVIVVLATINVHARDIVRELIDSEVSSKSSFLWQKQLRFYWDVEADTCMVHQSNANFEYGYEYEGATGCLVITPLTDRCWMTISGALHLKLGASPAGPAGTGKTESSKDLAKAMAVQCIVFNCSDQIDIKMMSQLFKGLSSAGAWTCLDEFNRIDIEVLSVIAQQMLVLRQARLSGVEKAMFDGYNIPIKRHHVIITMNPGYAGRTELPDNLKVMFRPVAMMVPDYALIAEIMLFSEGFDSATELSRKMTKMYKLSSEQLSQQRHYDYGMRAVKSVLVMAGSLKRANPDLSEDVVLIKACRDSNVPKFLDADLPLFHAIVKDLFPGVKVPYNDYGELEVAVREKIVEFGLQPHDAFILKVIQLFETQNVRFGVSMVGPTGGGKTTCYRVLAAAMSSLAEKGFRGDKYDNVVLSVLNPKSVTMGELYGENNPMTQEWCDGLASTILRDYAAEDTSVRKWTVFDGPIDALWIENMNTVLDDNMTLCLANGERIKLRAAMKCIFEVQDLEVASPATVSRLGVMYMTPNHMGWKPYVQSWIHRIYGIENADRDDVQQVPEVVRSHLFECFSSTVEKGLSYVRNSCTEPIATSDLNLVVSLCSIFEACFSTTQKVDFGLDSDELIEILEKTYIFAYAWSIGGGIDDMYRDDFDDFMQDTFDSSTVISADMPRRGTVYDNFIDEGEKHQFKQWSSIVPKFKFDAAVPYFQMLVPTESTVQMSFLLKKMLCVNKPTFVTGVTGTGKSVLVQTLLTNLQPSPEEGGMGILPTIIGFSAQTNAAVTQSMIESSLEKKSRTVLGAPVNRKIVVFVDDVNMPTVEEYGAQPPVELLRQFADFSGFYDREKQYWRDVVDTVLFVAGGPPGGGRNDLTPRFVRHFNVFCLPPANENAMEIIFGSILDGFTSQFSREIKKLSKPIVGSTIEIFYEISESMLPTPSKAHYTFNLRDVSKVFQGILQIKPANCKSAQVMSRLWIHEIQRVFHDRLINQEDREWFNRAVSDKIKRKLKFDWTYEEMFESGRPIMFGDFFKSGEEDYAEFQGDIKAAAFILQSSLDDYNVINSNKMNLVFFADAVAHVVRIARILRQPRGNALLIGIAGSGKQSLTRLSSFILEYIFFQIELTNGYGRADFHENIKEQMLVAGVEGKPVSWVFPDSQIVEESFVEDINNILNSGDIPNLWASDELDKVVDDLRPVMKREGKIGTRAVCLREFNNRIRDNFHIVLSFSPVGDAFRNRLRNFPSLINCTTIDWFNSWPETALTDVASHFLKDVELDEEDIRQDLVKMCVFVHTSIVAKSDAFFNLLRRKVYTTPKSYLDCIDLYKDLLEERRQEVSADRKRLQLGVKKLEETNVMVEEMQVTLTELQPILKQKAIETEELLKQVAIETVDAEKIEIKVRADETVVAKQAAETAALQQDAQKDLDRALPALKAAVQALKGLDKKDITEMKSFANPPKAVKTVLEAVCILLKQKPDWDTAKKVMTDSQFMSKLQKYDKDNIEPKIIARMKRDYLQHPDFQLDNVKKVSKAATSLCMWGHAMVVYDEVAKEVGPKKEKVKEMNEVLAAANATLKEKQDDLQKVLDRVANLKRTCDETVAEKQRLADESDKTVQRLSRAEKLTVGLADEFVRWKDGVEKLKVAENKLIGDTFLAAAGISYYGPFTGVYRNELMESWRDMMLSMSVPGTDGCTLVKAIGKPVEIRQWQINSLPSDWVSTDNAIMCTRGRRWPLMIDPQGQANRWIKKTESANHLEVTKMSNSNLLRVFENNIRNGTPVLIEDITETVDPSIENVLSKNTFQQGSRTLIRLGDTDVEYDKSFRFYMTSKMPNPHYVPEICIKVTIINFTVTMNGLEDQLLARVVKAERPDIEQKKDNLVLSMAEDKQQLADIESKILKLLADSTGNILDNVELINVLASSKTTSTVINERVAESEKTEIEINYLRNQYRPMAIRGAIVYFVIADFTVVDPMYQYSLEYYCRLFDTCMNEAEKSDDLERRLHLLIDYLTDYVYQNICRGLFERHKGTFAFVICAQILRNAGKLTDMEWNILLRGSTPVTAIFGDKIENPDSGFFSESQWDGILGLENDLPDIFLGLAQSICENVEEWKEWMNDKSPHRATLPGTWGLPFVPPVEIPPKNEEGVKSGTDEEADEDNEEEEEEEGKKIEVTVEERPLSGLSAFQKLLIIRCLREEKLVFATVDFVASKLGESFAVAPSASMSDVYADTNKITPCTFVLVSGADPTELLLQLAKSKDYGDRLNVISLGQGQGPRAEAMIEAATESGDWVLLQNCHLAKSWMPRLEKVVFGLIEAESSINDDFRLFLTSFPAAYFPVSVLQNSIKMTNEPPQGLRANIIRSFNLMIPEETWEEFSTVLEKQRWKKLLFGVTFFHAMTQERRKFGPLGWNIRYEFNDSDLQTSIEVLRNFLLECNDLVPWDSLTYVTGEINYGGRVTDDWDRRCLLQVLGKFYSPEIINDTYAFSGSGVYRAPRGEATYDTCMEYLKALPLKDDPEIFGMHENANVASQMQQTNELIQVVLMMQPRSSGGGGEKTGDQIVQEVAERLENSFPEDLRMENAGKTTFKVDSEGIMDSLGTVLSQELQKFNRLLRLARKTIAELQKAIKGLVVMSADLETMYEDFMFNNIPRLWGQVSYDSLKSLASYELDLQTRIEFMRRWLHKGRPSAFPLYLFFFPQGFLTGVLQNHARQYLVPINTLDFSFRIVRDVECIEKIKAPKDGVYIYGLWMEGARFDREKGHLEESYPGEMFSEMPTVHFLPTRDHESAKENYLCPVYKTTVRAGALSTTGISTNYVVAIELPTKEKPSHWIFEGVACVLNMND
jgi:dynein heavy chain